MNAATALEGLNFLYDGFKDRCSMIVEYERKNRKVLEGRFLRTGCLSSFATQLYFFLENSIDFWFTPVDNGFELSYSRSECEGGYSVGSIGIPMEFFDNFELYFKKFTTNVDTDAILEQARYDVIKKND